MLKGTVLAKDFVDEMISEIDVTLPQIERKRYIDWINTELFHIYSSAIRCIGVNNYKTENLAIDLNKPYDDTDYDFDLDHNLDAPPKPESINCQDDIDSIAYEDVYKVFGSSDNEYARSTYGAVIPGCKLYYYKNNQKLRLSAYDNGSFFKILFYKRPKKLTEENASEYVMPIPDPFLDVVRSKIRKEAFLLSGDIAISNAWGEQHDILFKNLSDWHSSRDAHYIR